MQKRKVVQQGMRRRSMVLPNSFNALDELDDYARELNEEAMAKFSHEYFDLPESFSDLNDDWLSPLLDQTQDNLKDLCRRGR